MVINLKLPLLCPRQVASAIIMEQREAAAPAAPASPGASSLASWAVPSGDQASTVTVVDGFKKQLSDDLKIIMDKFSGPAQYLQALTAQERQDFIDYLWQYFPEREDSLYHYDRDLPPVEEGEIGMTPATIVHVAALGFDSDCSLKPPPGKELFRQLSEHMLQDGFLTSGEPLLVVQSHQEHAISLNAPWPSPGGSGPGLAAASLG